MVSWSGHIVPLAVTLLIWFFATGLIAWADNRDRATFTTSLIVAGGVGIAGLIAIFVSSQSTSAFSIYLAFAGALMVWGWHEVGFLTGAVAGPRREPCDPELRGLDRFTQASATVIYHEIALALTALTLISLSWNAPNQIGATVFVLLFIMRLSTKLNMYVGVPNTSLEILPPHLAYLKSYFGRNRMTAMLAFSAIAIAAIAAWFASLAIAAPTGSAAMIGASLLFALCLLGAIEHVFLALPFRDGVLWGWALPNRARSTPISNDHNTIKTGNSAHGL